MHANQNLPNTDVRTTDPVAIDDGDCAAELVLQFLNRLGFSTGEFKAADFKPIVVPLLAALDLRVASPDRLEDKREMLSQQADMEFDHINQLRWRLRKLNGCEDDSAL